MLDAVDSHKEPAVLHARPLVRAAFWSLGLGSLLTAAAPAAAQDAPVALTNARLYTMAGQAEGLVDSGTLIVHKGKVVAAGANIPIPAGATTIDCKGKVIMPGIVDTHSHVGGFGAGDNSATVHPDARILDSIKVFDSGFKRVWAGGITTLNIMPGSGHLMSGQTLYVKNRGGSRIEDFSILDDKGQPMGGLKMANGTNPMRPAPFTETRGKHAATIRDLFIKAQEYRDKLKRFDDKAKADPAKAGEPPERNLGLEFLSRVLSREKIVQHHTHRADDIITVLRIAKEFGYRVVLHHTSEAWKVASEIAAADTGWGSKGIKGTPVSVILIDSPGGKLEAADARWETAAILEKAGVTLVFHTDDWITDSRVFLRSAALGIRAGLSRTTALRAMTINGAKMLDLDARVGSLEPGKDADFIILSGDPFSVYTKIEQTWVEGAKKFDRSNEKDRLYAVGGYGAGHDQMPYLCCAGQ
jgi:imidazolonepropionase-like amidohydrolase